MTTPLVDDPEILHRILARAEALFLDFDGPVCSVFAGLPASVVVDQLCVVLADGGYGDPPADVEKSSDPFDVLRYAATLGDIEAWYVNAALTAYEVEAIATAEPTPGAHELMRAWSHTGRPLAIVSNNSTTAVEAYLDLYGVRRYVAHVAGRTRPDPALLKPSPHLLIEASAALSRQPQDAVFIGDSATDAKAARSTGTAFIGFVNKRSKVGLLVDAGSICMTTSAAHLLRAIAIC